MNEEILTPSEYKRRAGTPPKYCVRCGKPLEGAELEQYCCNEHEAAYQDRRNHSLMHRYDRDTGQPKEYGDAKRGQLRMSPPNPYLS